MYAIFTYIWLIFMVNVEIWEIKGYTSSPRQTITAHIYIAPVVHFKGTT